VQETGTGQARSGDGRTEPAAEAVAAGLVRG